MRGPKQSVLAPISFAQIMTAPGVDRQWGKQGKAGIYRDVAGTLAVLSEPESAQGLGSAIDIFGRRYSRSSAGRIALLFGSGRPPRAT